MPEPADRTGSAAQGLLATLRRTKPHVAGLALLILAFFHGVVDFEFTLDSRYFMTEDARVAEFRLAELLTTDWWNAQARNSHTLESRGGLYRPLSLLWMATFRSITDEAALREDRSPPLNLANLMLHFVGVVLRFVLLLWILEGVRHAARWAFAGAAMLAIHPIASEAVCTQVGCAEALSVVFSTGSMLAFMRALAGGGRLSWCLHGVLFMGALLSKESAVALPFALILLGLLVTGRSLPRAVLASLTSFAVLLAWLLLRSLVIGSIADVDDEVLALFPTGARIATALAVIAAYDLPALVFPAWLHPNPTLMEIPPAAGSEDPRTVVGLAVIAGFVVALFVCWKRAPRVAFGLAFLSGMLLPLTNLLVMIGALAATRFLYLPLTGLALAVAAGASRLHARPMTRPLGWLLLAWFVVVPAVLNNAGEWRSQQTLFEAAADAYPEAPQAWYQLGAVHLAEGEMGKARVAFRRAASSPLPRIPGGEGRVFEDALELRFQTCINAGLIEMSELAVIKGRGDRRAYTEALKVADGWFERAAEVADRGLAMGAGGAPVKTDWLPLRTDALMQRGSVRLNRLGILPADQRPGVLESVRRFAAEIEEIQPDGLKGPMLRFQADQAAGALTKRSAETRLRALYRRALTRPMDEAKLVVQALVNLLQGFGRPDEAARALLDAESAGAVTPGPIAVAEAGVAAAASSDRATRDVGYAALRRVIERPGGLSEALLARVRQALARGR